MSCHGFSANRIPSTRPACFGARNCDPFQTVDSNDTPVILPTIRPTWITQQCSLKLHDAPKPDETHQKSKYTRSSPDITTITPRKYAQGHRIVNYDSCGDSRRTKKTAQNAGVVIVASKLSWLFGNRDWVTAGKSIECTWQCHDLGTAGKPCGR